VFFDWDRCRVYDDDDAFKARRKRQSDEVDQCFACTPMAELFQARSVGRDPRQDDDDGLALRHARSPTPRSVRREAS